MIWFTSDLHFGHKNIIKHSERPFKSVEEMDQEIITRWQKTVASQDTIYVVGDFSFHKPKRTLEILQSLPGTKFLVSGNHDKDLNHSELIGDDKFVWIKDLYNVKVPDTDAHGAKQRIVLCHYAMLVWDQSHRGAWQLHGHSHGTIKEDPNSLRIDVGVDSNDYRPISYFEVKERMKKKEWKPVDHHGADRE